MRIWSRLLIKFENGVYLLVEVSFYIVYYTQQHKLRTAYSTNDYIGKWVVIY